MQPAVIVDDDRPNTVLYTTIIERVLRANAIAFVTPNDALGYLGTSESPLIVVDFHMPDMNGIEFIDAVRLLPMHERTPILMITASDAQHLKTLALRAGADAFLRKPTTNAELVAQIRRLTGWKEQSMPVVTGSVMGREREAILHLYRAMEARDPNVAHEMRRACDLSVRLARTISLPSAEIETLRSAALVYDIGKLAIPEEVLAARESLSPNGRRVVDRHAEAGATILGGSDSMLFRNAETIARYHHERYDGSGYPARLRGPAIPLFARIVAIADTYVALTSMRPYRYGMQPTQAINELKAQSGKQFDPELVSAFESVMTNGESGS